MKNILFSTLGGSWAVIPEIYGFLAPEQLPLYERHPEKTTFDDLRKQFGLQAPDEIWICTSQGTATQKALDALQRWATLLPEPVGLRIWQAEGTDELASQQECRLIRELIARVCLKAHAEAAGGQVTLSLAGGRKTMSADLQWAASLFGCTALLHVIGKDYQALPDELKRAEPELFTRPFDADCCAAVMPLVAGRTQRSDILYVERGAVGAVTDRNFPLPMPECGAIIAWSQAGHWLEAELRNREQESGRLLGNYLQTLSVEERHENWRSLYRLPPRVIETLRRTPLGADHRAWLDRLPKADLHRHLGGCLDLAAQQRVARAIWDDLTKPQRSAALQRCRGLLDAAQWEWPWPETLKRGGHRSHDSACLLLYSDEDQLRRQLWQATEPRVALNQSPQGFPAYERPGELTGSAVLTHPAALEPYAQAIVDQAVAEGLAYVELRGSPQKYDADGLRFLAGFHTAIAKALASLPTADRPVFRFIVIVDRRDGHNDRISHLQETISTALRAQERWPDFVVGLDVAGDERQTEPKAIADLFNRAFERCLPITIHAGEGQPAESIWQAAYHLHADRIGHGLTLIDNAQLAQRFRNRDICLELCPTSNREVVGFYDPERAETQGYPLYPAMQLWREGLPLTLCTDNPGISRTTLSEEYLTAARMSQTPLTQWDALAMIKQGFVHAFLPSHEKEALLKQSDAAIYRRLEG